MQRDLKRTRLRALALLVNLEEKAGDGAAAAGFVGDYVRSCGASGYARPLVRVGIAAVAAMARFLTSKPEASVAEIGERLSTALADITAVPQFRGKQHEVLLRLATQRDKEIAAAMGLSRHTVRYHLRSIFRKLGANSRLDAVRRAEALGILPLEP